MAPVVEVAPQSEYAPDTAEHLQSEVVLPLSNGSLVVAGQAVTDSPLLAKCGLGHGASWPYGANGRLDTEGVYLADAERVPVVLRLAVIPEGNP